MKKKIVMMFSVLNLFLFLDSSQAMLKLVNRVGHCIRPCRTLRGLRQIPQKSFFSDCEIHSTNINMHNDYVPQETHASFFCQTGEQITNKINNNTSLRILNLNYCQVENVGIAHHNLHTLKISKSAFNFYQLLNRCPNLVELYLYNCKNFGFYHLERLFGEGKNLRKFWLQGTKIHEKNIKHLFESSLELRDVALIGSDFKSISISHAKLQNLNLSFTSLTDTDATKIVELCPCLKILRLIGCKNITTPVLKSQNLCVLDLQDTNITDQALLNICSNCPNLKVLHIAGTPIKQETIDLLCQFYEKLVINE